MLQNPTYKLYFSIHKKTFHFLIAEGFKIYHLYYSKQETSNNLFLTVS